MMNRNLQVGRYRHYKGNDYQVLHVVQHSETREYMVVYRCLYGDFSLWVRPYDMFVERVVVEGVMVPRFAFIGIMTEECITDGSK